MRDLEALFSRTLFLEAGKGIRHDEEHLWMIAEHLREDETGLAYVSLKASNLLLTEQRLLELTPHLDEAGFWNVRHFHGYQVHREVLWKNVTGFSLSAEGSGGTLRLQIDKEELAFAIPLEASGDASETLDPLETVVRGALGPKS